ncbi:lysophospholipid acyltransferase lpeat1 [Phtheirospermum japonicum]|uniref:Lysophospholipid acyltransferase lpeat1 n=1 Tax=Phtheirospermum japonicum TaxID=374723 RepID=A0A830CPN2_9LAMI|nr:lysophospholipid acyltransferase lpeat1 [Phtheirospermum japonicum]
MESELKAQPPKPAVPQPEPDTSPLLKPEPETPQPQNPVQNLSTEDMEKKYAPFVRYDIYGPMGCGELPLVEKFLLAMALMFVVPMRLMVGTTVLVVYYLICRGCTAFLAPNREDEGEQEDYAHIGGWRRAVIVASGRFLSRVMLFVFGFYWISETSRDIEVDGQLSSEDQSEEMRRPGVIVSNHVSYIDILYHMSSSLPSFVAKSSVAKLPLVGLISKCLGCVYVQRDLKSSDFKGVSAVITERIREAHQNKSAPRILLFPEGTTTNGDYLLPFKTGAFLAKAPVLPVILRYPFQRFSPAWDSISGARHVILLLCQFVNYIEVMKLSVYHPSEQEKEDPKLYAENVRQLMAREGNLTVSHIGLAEKRVYLAALNGLLSER